MGCAVDDVAEEVGIGPLARDFGACTRRKRSGTGANSADNMDRFMKNVV